MTPAILTLAEVAAHFRQPEKFIRRLAATHAVPCLRGSRGAYLFTAAHVEAIERHLTQPTLTQVVPQRRRRSA